MSASKINSFIAERITLTKNGSIANKDLLEAFYTYANATTGRNSLYNQIKDMEGVTRTKTHFKGITMSVVATPMIHPMPQAKQDNVLSAYELKCIELKERELAQQKELEAIRLAAEKENEAIRLAAEKENEAIRLAAEKENEAIRLAAEKENEAIRLAAEKEMKEREMLAEKEMKAQEVALKEQELINEKEMNDRKMIAERELKEKEIRVQERAIECKIELKLIDVAEKEKDRAFMREENNKNRRMHMSLRHNKYLDFEVFGTPSNQYIERSSLVNVLGFSAYDALTEYKPELLKAIDVEASSVSKRIPVYENTTTKQIDAIDLSDAMKVVEKISKQVDAPCLIELNDIIDRIQEVAVSDECRTIPSAYISKKSIQDPSTHNRPKHKLKYVKAINKLHSKNGNVLIQCSCCNNIIDLEDNGCHRAHDIPKSDGGDWSAGNVYLTCAQCNMKMSDDMSVREYKVGLYVQMIEQD